MRKWYWLGILRMRLVKWIVGDDFSVAMNIHIHRNGNLTTLGPCIAYNVTTNAED